MLRCAVLTIAIVLLAAAVASAANTVAVYSDPGDFLGQGEQDVFGAGAQITTEPDALLDGNHVVVDAYDPALGAWELTFAAPDGERLEPRKYVDAQRAVFADPGHPGLSASADSQRGCNTVYGRFEIRDIVRRADGSVRRLWAVFQLHCEGKFPATWGEARIGMPASAVTPTIVRWPEQDAWQAATRVPVRYEGAAPLTGVSLAGADPGDFDVDDGGCRATTCTLHVTFDPTAAGARSAILRLTDAAGSVHDVALEGFRHGGISRAVIEDVLELELEPQRPKTTYVHETPSSRFAGLYYDSGLVSVYTDDAERWWELRLWPGAAGWKAGTTYSNVMSGSGGGTSPAMGIIGRDTACNASSQGSSFTLLSISREPDGGLRTLDVTFDQPCYEDAQKRPGLHGRWQYRAGDTSPFADWLVPGPRAGLGPLPPEAPAPGGTAPASPAAGATTSAGAGVTSLSASAARRALAACERPGVRRRVAGGSRGDVLRGGPRAERLLGRGGRDRLLGRGGDDCLYGGAGNDRLDGGAGRDRLFGGSGDDVLAGGPGADVLDCGTGRRDRATAGPGDRTRRCEKVLRVAR